MRTIDEIALSHNPTGEILVDDTHAVMSETTKNQLLVYEATLPTGTTIGKRWRNHNIMGEYEDCDDPKKVLIRWREILIVE